jgi:hypothetical protein
VANHRANVRAALRWYGEERGVPQHGAPLMPEWERFVGALEKPLRRRLYNLARYFSMRTIEPSSISDALFEEYWRYRTDTADLPDSNSKKRFIVRAWNACAAAASLPLQPLTEPPIKTASPAWEEFPVGLRRQIDDYWAGFARPHRTFDRRRMPAWSASTLAYRRAELVAFCRKAVKLGILSWAPDLIQR